MKKNIVFALASITVVITLFTSCGGDTGSEVECQEKNDVVSSIYNLGDCSENFDGDIVFVKDERIEYICQNGKWNPVEGDSEKSSNQSENKLTSSSENNASCSSNVSSGKNELKEPVVTNASVSGFSQKGPFVKGASVSVQELDGKTFVQTGKSFKGKVSNDNGEFSISSVTLASSYAILEVTGYFLNEVSGKKSNSTITLNAITDFSNRKTANINLLTHLEYDRVIYLVDTGMDIDSAKRQAKKELFNAFEIDSFEMGFEDMNIFGEEKEDAALLAVSVLVQGNRTEAELTELLTSIAADIKTDGKWDDKMLKKEIAGWAFGNDLGGTLEFIRKNVEDWQLGVVPAFEKYIRNFWQKYYNVSDCDENLEGEMVSIVGSTCVCKNNLWRYATYLDSLGDCSEDSEGTMKTLANSENPYVCDGKSWRTATFPEKIVGPCSWKNKGDVAIERYSIGKKMYTFALQCADTGWIAIAFDRYDSLSLKCSANGDVVHSELTDVYYVCESGKIKSLDVNDLEKNKTGSGNLWDYSRGNMVSIDSSTDSYWWAVDDHNDSGDSYIINSKGERENLYQTGEAPYFISKDGISQNQGILFGFHLGEKPDYAFVETGFNFTNDRAAKDISAWNGFCIVYASSVPFKLLIEDYNNWSNDYNEVVVPSSLSTVVKNFAWSEFAQGGWGMDEISIETASKKAVGLRLQFMKSNSVKEGSVYIKAVGKLMGCSVE